jgi:hypothetical protein
MISSGRSTASIRRQELRRYSRFCGLLKSNQLCLVCVKRTSEHHQSCGHTICDTCSVIFGKLRNGYEHCYSIERCLVCQKKVFFTVQLSPPTAGKRMLSLDGGGIKIVVSLKLLQALEQVLGLPYPLQEHFDYGIGTSSGILKLMMYVKPAN